MSKWKKASARKHRKRSGKKDEKVIKVKRNEQIRNGNEEWWRLGK